MFKDVEYITNRIYEIYHEGFKDISFKTEIHERTCTLHINIEGNKRRWHFFMN